ncbi:Protein SKG3 [Nakaseomyces bracarensis]|uniref:Protein SKG3 n=1 Tax=Nakaseomyces bracarensis TaxID=273131 RepID=A0ABR4NQA8_9SACH
MKRIFSGSKSPDGVSKSPTKSPIIGKSPIMSKSPMLGKSILKNSEMGSPRSNISPELVPIVTLLTAHTHRRYQEGVILFLQDLKGDGSVGGRQWKEVYAVLIGTQLALWDAREIAELNASDREDPLKVSAKLKQAVSKPTYINFTDSTLKPLGAMDRAVTESGKKLENVLVVSSTLKNRYFLQFSNKESFSEWHAAFRLSLYECTSLNMAYTGAFLSSRGSKLSDIKIQLADTKHDYEEWVSVRFGAGMPWKRCYAVVSQPAKKRSVGEINFYESDKKIKKSNSMAKVVSADYVYAIYPSSVKLIDDSTIIKLEGQISFEKKEDPQDTTVFIMPEKHNAVPGYDTVIRFMIKAFNAFKLYGRPKKLISDKRDMESLIFALPVLPHIYYLEIDDLLSLANSAASLVWDNKEWWTQIRGILQRKLNEGYSGCGSIVDASNILESPLLGSGDLFDAKSITSPRSVSQPIFQGKNASNSIENLLKQSPEKSANSPSHSTDQRRIVSEKVSPTKYGVNKDSKLPPNPYQKQNNNLQSNYNMNSSDSIPVIPPLPNSNYHRTKSSQNNMNNRRPDELDIKDSNFNAYGNNNYLSVKKSDDDKKLSVASDLASLIEKYSLSEEGEVKHDISLNDPNMIRNGREQYYQQSHPKSNQTNDVSSDEFSDLARSINELGMENGKGYINKKGFASSSSLPKKDGPDDSNLFDPDYLVQNDVINNDAYGNFNNPYSSKFEGELISPKIPQQKTPYPLEPSEMNNEVRKSPDRNGLLATGANPYKATVNNPTMNERDYSPQMMQPPPTNMMNNGRNSPGIQQVSTPPAQMGIGMNQGITPGSWPGQNGNAQINNQQMNRPPPMNGGFRGNNTPSPVKNGSSPMSSIPPGQGYVNNGMRPPPHMGANGPMRGSPRQQPMTMPMPVQGQMGMPQNGMHPNGMQMGVPGQRPVPMGMPGQIPGQMPLPNMQRPPMGMQNVNMPPYGYQPPSGQQYMRGMPPQQMRGPTNNNNVKGSKRPMAKGGFSQFMPPTNQSANPYSN